MTDKTASLSPIQLQFRSAKAAICDRKDNVRQQGTKSKSYAQVETLVRPQAVSPKSGELKLGRKRHHRLMARFSEAEREIVTAKAQASHLSVNEFIRVSVLGAGYVSSTDPVKRKLLLDISRELGRQGNNLNQIAKHLNAGIAAPEQGDSMLAIIARSLLAAHKVVRQTLAEGQTEE